MSRFGAGSLVHLGGLVATFYLTSLAFVIGALGPVPIKGMALILGVGRFKSECRSLINFIGNAVATIVVARWEGKLDAAKLTAVLDAPPPTNGVLASVKAIWLKPIYPSPQADSGYDVADFKAIDPRYSTMADFDRMVAEAKKRGIGVIMDLMLNHTSDKHS